MEENKIEAVLINEVSPVLLQSPWGPRSDPSRLPGMIQAVTSTDAYYYLCFVMKSGDDMALAFPVRSPPPCVFLRCRARERADRSLSLKSVSQTSRPGVDFLAAAYNEAKALLEKKR